MKSKKAIFEDTIKIYPTLSSSRWYFVILPLEISNKLGLEDIKTSNIKKCGAIKAVASIANVKWQTSLFPTKSLNTKKVLEYIMFIKSSVRKEIGLVEGDRCQIKLILG